MLQHMPLDPIFSPSFSSLTLSFRMSIGKDRKVKYKLCLMHSKIKSLIPFRSLIIHLLLLFTLKEEITLILLLFFSLIHIQRSVLPLTCKNEWEYIEEKSRFLFLTFFISSFNLKNDLMKRKTFEEKK